MVIGWGVWSFGRDLGRDIGYTWRLLWQIDDVSLQPGHGYVVTAQYFTWILRMAPRCGVDSFRAQ